MTLVFVILGVTILLFLWNKLPVELVAILSLLALVFTGVSRGRSPMIAVKISPFKPRVIILHGLDGEIDPLAVQLARHENIPLAVSGMETEDELVASLIDLYQSTG